MPLTTAYATMLEQLGVFLSRQEAQEIEIVDEGQFLSVSWQPSGGSRQQACFRMNDLPHLGSAVMRTPTRPTRATLLGILGKRLDRAGLDVARIVEKGDGFLVSGSRSGKYRTLTFPYLELEAYLSVEAPQKSPIAGSNVVSSLAAALGATVAPVAANAMPSAWPTPDAEAILAERLASAAPIPATDPSEPPSKEQPRVHSGDTTEMLPGRRRRSRTHGTSSEPRTAA